MFKPLALFIGLRYTRAKHRNHFVSLISLLSMLGIALGIIVLITVLSVLNGFDREIKKSIFSILSPITISSFAGPIENWQELTKSIQILPEISGVAPFVSGQALLQNDSFTQPVRISGIIPAEEETVSSLTSRMVKGNLSDLKTRSFNIILSEELATDLNVTVGEKVTIVSPQGSLSSTNFTPRFDGFTVIGIFRGIGGGFNVKLAYINLYDAQKIFNLGSSVTALHANITDIYSAPKITQQLKNQISPMLTVTNWTQQLGDFFQNIRLTKTIMFFIFLLIIVVAVFNLICTLVMAVKSKQADIAILRTMGATPGMIMAVFVVQGATIGIGGILLGIVGGIELAWHVTAIVDWIQHIFQVQFLSSSIYFVDFLPSELQWSDVWKISLVALAFSLIATLYPSWQASRIEPVEALRYD